MSSQISTAHDWSAEYEKKGIPSSVRSEPSGSLRTLLSYLDQHKVEPGTAIDIGCGTGRNSIDLAKHGYSVISFDFAKPVIEAFSEALKDGEFAKSIQPVCQDVTKLWPVTTDSVDVAIDTFCFKHQIPLEHREFYRGELDRTLKAGGHFLLTLAGLNDGYYKLFPAPHLGDNAIVDPANGIPSVLYSKDDILEFFGGFKLVDYKLKAKPSEMHGTVYPRETHLFIFEKA